MLRTFARTLCTSIQSSSSSSSSLSSSTATSTISALEALTIPLKTLNGASLPSTMALPPTLFMPPRQDILHRMVLYQLARNRQGTVKTLRRDEVAGSTRKIVPQKHTGGARHGDNRSNIFVGGGRAHGPLPRSWSHALPKKVRKMALSMALGASLVNQRLHVVDIESESAKISGKTSELASMLEQAGWRPQRAVSLRRERSRISEEEFRQTTEDEQLLKGGFPRVYMVAGQDHIHENLARAVSNLEGVHVVPRKGLNCLDLLKSDVVLLSPGAIEYWQNVHASANKGGLASSAQ